VSILATDGYKFSMAEAGWPLRTETFYYTQRKGGPGIVPLDLRAEIARLLPTPAPGDHDYLTGHEYEMCVGFKAAMGQHAALAVHALPKGSWFLPREPVFAVTGPSALASWLEPLALQLHYRIQVATLALTNPAELEAQTGTVTCEAQRDIVLATLDSVGVRAPKITADPEGYFARVKGVAAELVAIVGDPARIFEVGLRSATCLAQHLIALEACKSVGIVRTSNVLGARTHGMIPVGTMGHEHIQRYGSDDAAFRAMRDRRPGRSSYLLDTFDTLRCGIPAAFRLMEEDKRRGDSIRYDSGDKEAQYRFAAAEAARRGLRPVQILEDAFDAPLTRRFEELRREVGLGPEEQFYGYGGYLVATTSGSRLTRDRVAAVFKLSQTAIWPTMKFGDEAGSGKESVPGKPVVFRRTAGTGPVGIIGQEGEDPPAGYAILTAAESPLRVAEEGGVLRDGTPEPSPATRAIADELRARRAALTGEQGAPYPRSA
jgi:nicotinic acid phosphoribosyltransferase